MKNDEQKARPSVPNQSPEFQTEGIFGSSRGLHIRFETSELAKECYESGIALGHKLTLEGSQIIYPWESLKSRTPTDSG